MKKYVKTIIIVSVLAIMCIVYFFYLSNRKSTKDATDNGKQYERTGRSINSCYRKFM